MSKIQRKIRAANRNFVNYFYRIYSNMIVLVIILIEQSAKFYKNSPIVVDWKYINLGFRRISTNHWKLRYRQSDSAEEVIAAARYNYSNFSAGSRRWFTVSELFVFCTVFANLLGENVRRIASRRFGLIDGTDEPWETRSACSRGLGRSTFRVRQRRCKNRGKAVVLR